MATVVRGGNERRSDGPAGKGGEAGAQAGDGAGLEAVLAATQAPRVIITEVRPALDEGRFGAKAVQGERVAVSAVIFADGHEVLAAALRWRHGDGSWRREVMSRLEPAGLDRWQASFRPERCGRHHFVVEAWWDVFGTWRSEVAKKHQAGVSVRLELEEGRRLLAAAVERSEGGTRQGLIDVLRRFAEDENDGARVALLLSREVCRLMAEADARPHLAQTHAYPIYVDRYKAQFSAWYELFPRSETDSPERHGTFLDVLRRLPMIRDMGFDVLYFPPIHPIGKTHRKGRNNSLRAGHDDPGSPYAIGSPDGGHEDIHPELGTREDFHLLLREAAAQGLEIALDFAVQCSPDHPWLEQHPGWFSWRPDGSIRYAENPPKKYQDIVNVDFYARDAIPALWLRLRDVVQGWVDQGVRIFRVDNPHTKPAPFWEWLIEDIQSRDPGVIFLAEAFTRPAVMLHLGKLGFNQSYTYFTWRNAKHELSQYLSELASSPWREGYRPNFFVNTPDINPTFLHSSVRPGFLIRAALAATAAGSWGMYSGFELCEGEPVPGKEEYLDSEKYEIKARDYKAPGNIVWEIAQLNRIRRENPALHSHLNNRLYTVHNERLLYYWKRSPAQSEVIFVMINLDPCNAQGGAFELPLWELGLPDDAALEAEDLMSGERWTWRGRWQHTWLGLQRPFGIWRAALPKRD